MAILKDRNCPKCEAEASLFICSFGAVNCSECGEFIRKCTNEELEIAHIKFKQLRKAIKKTD